MVDKEKQIQEYQHKQLIDELSKMPPMVISTAYLYAINYTLYGEDVTEKWLTATQQASALEKSYRKGYYDALQELKGENKSEQIDVEFNHEAFYEFLLNTINPNEMEKYRSMFLSSGKIVN